MEYVDLIEKGLIRVGQKCFDPKYGEVEVIAINVGDQIPIRVKAKNYELNYYSNGFETSTCKAPMLQPREGVAHWNDEKPLYYDGEWVIRYNEESVKFDIAFYDEQESIFISGQYHESYKWDKIEPFNIDTLPKLLKETFKTFKEDYYANN